MRIITAIRNRINLAVENKTRRDASHAWHAAKQRSYVITRTDNRATVNR